MGGRWVAGDFAFVSPTKARALEANQAHPGDIVFTQRGTLGQVSLVPERPFHAYVVSQSQMKLSVSRSIADPLFVFYYFRNREQQKLIQGSAIQTGVPHINLGILRALPIQLPPLAQQRAIAAVLSDVDELIGSLEALIAKKRDMKQAAMQQLLTGRTRLPGFEGEWDRVRAGDIGRFGSGSGFPVRYQGRGQGDYPFFKVSDMNRPGNERLLAESRNYITDRTRQLLGAVVFPPRSIVFAKVGAAVFLERKRILANPSCLDNNMAAFMLTDGRADSLFIYYLFTTIQLSAFASTTALPSLNGVALSGVQFSLPPLPEQRAIATVLSDMDAEITALERRLDKTRAIKQGMMQQLLTGSIRLPIPDADREDDHAHDA